VASGPSGGAIRQIHKLLDIGAVGTMSDAQLLECFISRRDNVAPAAFEALVIRHGPMVLRVCRGVLRNPDDAEDAFQAVFLVLAGKADAIQSNDSVASWLFGVARRTAARMKRDDARRRRLDPLVAERPPTSDLQAVDADDWEILHEEVQGLPERLRAPVVLCYLQGLSYAVAAQRLGLTEVAIRGRLARARDRLRQRLTRRGAAIPDGIAIVGATARAGEAVPGALIDSTVRMSLGFIEGGTAAILARGVLNSMLLHQVRVAAALLSLAVGGGCWAWHALASPADDDVRPVPGPAVVQPPDRVPAAIQTSVSGRAVDEQGNPIRGATVSLFSLDSQGLNLTGRTVTDREGRYVLADTTLPVLTSFNGYPFPKEITPYAEFMLSGTAPGLGIAWSGPKSIYALKQPDPNDIQERRLPLGEPVVLDLKFRKAATLQGKAVDDEGNALPGAKLQVRSVDLLDDDGREMNYPQGYDLRVVLGPTGRAVADPEGRFRMDGLPDRACFFISASRREAGGTTVNFYAATIDGPNTVHEELPPNASNGRSRHEVKTGDLAIILPKLRPIAVTVLADDTDRPLPGVRISTTTPVAEVASSGKTDDAGRTTLNLPPGRYEIYSDPPIETRYVRTEHPTLVVKRGDDAQTYVVRQKAGLELLITAVEADTGKPVAGARFWKAPEDQPDRQDTIQPSTFIVERPCTDSKGKLRAVLPPEPGQHFRLRFAGIRGPNGGADPDEAYEAEPAESALIESAPGKTVRLRFVLRKSGRRDASDRLSVEPRR
jgi:RNA polymerase sigma factor (sigma-70 family)